MYVIKRETNSWRARQSQYRTVKDLPTFETREEAEAFLKAKKPYGRCIVDRATPKKEIPNTTCQICGREILANTGVIAHHGYQRPGHGWQTASCFGAHYRPYEVACDALPDAIDNALRLRGFKAANHLQLIYEPPAQVDVSRRDAYGARRGEPKYVDRPIGFDATKGSPGSYRPGTYESVFWPSVTQIEFDLRNLKEYIEFLRERLAAWKAPTEEIV